MGKDDIRKQGSGNPGTTNMLRSVGKMAALYTLIGDLVKGAAAALFGYLIMRGNGAAIGSAAVILGHAFPVYFGFKGGKGIATGAGLLLIMDWRVFIVAVGLFAVLTVLTKYVSIGSIAAALTNMIMLPALHINNIFYICAAVFISILILFRHRNNIIKLLNKTENKLSFTKKE